MHIWLRNGFPIALLLGPWLGPTCRLSSAVATELSVAAAYLALSIMLFRASIYLRGWWINQEGTPGLSHAFFNSSNAGNSDQIIGQEIGWDAAAGLAAISCGGSAP